MKNYSVLALLGVTSAATGPLPATTGTNVWPKYATVALPSGTSLSTNAVTMQYHITSGYASAGPYRCYRNGCVVFLTQNLTVASSAQTVTTQSTVVGAITRTFYPHSLTEVGTYPGVASANTSNATGATWVSCLPTMLVTNATCNGGVGRNTGTSADTAIANRIYAQAGITTALTIGGSAATAYTWNEDLLLSSMYHPVSTATLVTDGSKWCSPYLNVLAQDQTVSSLTASQGLNGNSKCTWLITTTDGSKGPTILMKTLGANNFIFHWVEWIKGDTSALGAGAILPAADGAAYYLGVYGSTLGVMLNPVKVGPSSDTTWTSTTLEWAHSEYNPAARMPGSIGDAIFYGDYDGPFKAEGTTKVDQGVIQEFYDYFTAQYTAYNTAVGTYNTLKDTYNTAWTKEDLRQKDFVQQALLNPFAVPARPCPPSQPIVWEGPSLKLKQAFAATPITWTTVKTDKDAAYLAYSTTNMPNEKFSNRQGFLTTTPDSTGLTVTNVGHVFGRLGEGAKNYPGDTYLPVYWNDVATTNSPGMMVSLFGAVDSDTGLNSNTKSNVIEAKAYGWADLDSFNVPSQPSAATSPMGNAVGLSLGCSIAFMVVATSLY